MKVLLVNPPNCGRSIPEEEYGIDSLKQILRAEPLCLETLAGGLREHEVRIIDLKAEADGFEEILEDFRPEVVGITGVTCEANTMLKLAATTKKLTDAVVVVGGVHASNDPSFFNRENIDYIVIGLGKKSFRELVAALESGGNPNIPGIAKAAPSRPLSFTPRLYSSSDLVEEYAPRYDLVEKYRKNYILETFGFALGLVSVAFGCPFRCSFCSIAPITGGSYLTAGVETILRDISLLGDIPVIRLVDANTFGSVSHSKALCEAIQNAGIKKNFVADVRSDTVVQNPDLFAAWKKVGLRSVIIGFEEIDNGRLALLQKANTESVNAEAIRILHEIGITIVGDFIVSPDYDEEAFDDLGRYLETNRVDLPMLSILTPLPGTRLYETMKERITIHDLDFYTLTNSVLPTKLDEKLFYEKYADLMKLGHARARL